MPAPIIIAAIISAAVTGIGMAIEAGNRGEANNIRKKIADQFGDVALSQLDEALMAEIPASALAGVVEDSKLRSSQLGVLSELEEEYRSGGMGESDVAALRLVQQDAGANAARNAAEVEGNMARRGLGNSGLNAALQMQAGQSGANAAGRAGIEMQAGARMRALRALEGAGSLAGNVRSDDWRSASAKAQAQDSLNRYNNELPMRNAAFNNNVKNQRYDQEMDRLTRRSNAELGHASGVERAGQHAAQGFNAVGQTALGVGDALDQEERENAQREREKQKRGGY